MDLRKTILFAFIMSGMAALIYEVVWTRPLQFIFGSTIYTVSIIFAAFMGGLALGSFIASRYADKINNLPAAYALLELGIGLYGVLLLIIFKILPYSYDLIYSIHKSFYVFEFAQFIIIFVILLIPTTLMGATFPIIAKYYTSKKIGKGIGEVYAANNIGAILGSFVAGFILVPILGIKVGIVFAAVINIVIAFFILYKTSPRFAKKVIPFAFILFVILIFIGSYNIKQLYSSGFTRAGYPEEMTQKAEFLYYEEGLHATVTVMKGSEGATVLMFNGKGQGSSIITDLRVNFLLAYLPILIKQDAKDALVIGLGTGTTSGQLAQHVKTKTVEIESAVLDAVKYFYFMNENVLNNPNHKIIIDDARNYLFKNKEKYDLIVQEPSDPWQSFSTNLYSQEFFQIASNHLTENGLYVQWIPIYDMDAESFRSFYKTFNSVFPNSVAFASIKQDEDLPVKYHTPEIIMIGSNQKIELNQEKMEAKFNSLPPRFKEYFNGIRLNSFDKIMHLLLFKSEQMKGYGENSAIITDNHPRLEFTTAKQVLYQNPKEVVFDIEKFLEKNNENK